MILPAIEGMIVDPLDSAKEKVTGHSCITRHDLMCMITVQIVGRIFTRKYVSLKVHYSEVESTVVQIFMNE